jgi:2-phosphoglycerate kinase
MQYEARVLRSRRDLASILVQRIQPGAKVFGVRPIAYFRGGTLPGGVAVPYSLSMTSANGAVGIPGLVFVGGAPGVGKTNVARPLATRLGMNLTHVDDFYLVLERMTDPERFPPIHEWRLHPDQVLARDAAGMLDHTKEVSEIVAQAITPVIADRLESGIRTVFEGDFIQPAFAASETFDGVPAAGRVRSVFVYDTLDQFAVNIAAREGEDQPRRAHISWSYSEWMRAECQRLGVASIPARPWETAVDRALDAIGATSMPASAFPWQPRRR